MKEPAAEDDGTGPRARFEALTLGHLGYLYRFALRLCGNRSDADDLVQETYVKALRAFPTLREPERARAWLCQILSRLVLDRHRTGEREVPAGDLTALDRFSLYDVVADEDPFPYSDRLHQDFLEQFENDEVRQAWLTLPEVYRVPLMLLYTEEMSYAELAKTLGCPIGTVMSRLHRGRKLLERQLWEFAKRRGLVRAWNR